jgi:signal transduction histidine kinase
LSKTHKEQDLREFVYQLFPELPRVREERAHFKGELEELRERNRLLEKRCRSLRQELKSLQSGGKHRQLAKKEESKERDKTVDVLREKLGHIEKEHQMLLAHQHDLVNTSGLVTKSLEEIASKPELIPSIIQDELRRAGIAAKHFSILVESMHDLTGSEKLRKGPQGDISRSFMEAREIIARKIPNSITVNVKLPAGLPTSVIPDNLLVRCAMNLLLNSLDAIPNRGRIEVGCGRKLRGKGKRIEVVIRDTGRGILKRDLSKVFNWDFSTKGKKYGMGLFIVKTIMDKYGGSVNIESTRGKGTKIRLGIPVA